MPARGGAGLWPPFGSSSPRPAGTAVATVPACQTPSAAGAAWRWPGSGSSTNPAQHTRPTVEAGSVTAVDGWKQACSYDAYEDRDTATEDEVENAPDKEQDAARAQSPGADTCEVDVPLRQVGCAAASLQVDAPTGARQVWNQMLEATAHGDRQKLQPASQKCIAPAKRPAATPVCHPGVRAWGPADSQSQRAGATSALSLSIEKGAAVTDRISSGLAASIPHPPSSTTPAVDLERTSCVSAHPALITSGQALNTSRGAAEVHRLQRLPANHLAHDAGGSLVPAEPGSIISHGKAAASAVGIEAVRPSQPRPVILGGSLVHSKANVVAVSMTAMSGHQPFPVASGAGQGAGQAAGAPKRPQESGTTAATVDDASFGTCMHVHSNCGGPSITSQAHATLDSNPQPTSHGGGSGCNETPSRAANTAAIRPCHPGLVACKVSRPGHDLTPHSEAAAPAGGQGKEGSGIGESPPAWFASGAHLHAGVGLLQCYMQHPPGDAARDQLWACSCGLSAASLMAMPPRHLREHWLLTLQREFEAATERRPNQQTLAALRNRRDVLENLCDQLCLKLATVFRADLLTGM
ncbi:hypothetical protein WJX74_005221 [Apatococcus lobatus]|uniref:Uncharacterized protein n=1 Tax=Apatococcus lobatus TaxID=904363 RepID=A0AAW1RCU4_9CHLO